MRVHWVCSSKLRPTPPSNAIGSHWGLFSATCLIAVAKTQRGPQRWALLKCQKHHNGVVMQICPRKHAQKMPVLPMLWSYSFHSLVVSKQDMLTTIRAISLFTSKLLNHSNWRQKCERTHQTLHIYSETKQNQAHTMPGLYLMWKSSAIFCIVHLICWRSKIFIQWVYFSQYKGTNKVSNFIGFTHIW